jgi:hypothetical protein
VVSSAAAIRVALSAITGCVSCGFLTPPATRAASSSTWLKLVSSSPARVSHHKVLEILVASMIRSRASSHSAKRTATGTLASFLMTHTPCRIEASAVRCVHLALGGELDDLDTAGDIHHNRLLPALRTCMGWSTVDGSRTQHRCLSAAILRPYHT